MNSNNDAVIEFLLNQLRQQLTNNPYKQQCEDLAHEVLSLKNQLRDMSELVDELLGTITLMNGKSSHRKEDTQKCEHEWVIMPGLFLSESNPDNVPGSELCCKCGKREWDVKGYKPKADTQECKHDWVLDEKGDYFVCAKCGKQEVELNACQHTNTVGLRKGFAPGFTEKCLDCGAKLK